MSQDITVIEKEALNLPTADRAKLAERLLTSLDKPDPDIDQLWIAEADARVEAYDSGQLGAAPADQVFGKYRD